MTPSGIESVTFRFVAQHLNHCATAEASAGSPDNILAELHPNSNIQQIKKETANVVVQQHSRKIPEDGYINARNMLSF